MDPNETLNRLRRLTAIHTEWYDSDNTEWVSIAICGNEIVELITALDEWLSRGGFPPQAWRDAGHTPVA